MCLQVLLEGVVEKDERIQMRITWKCKGAHASSNSLASSRLDAEVLRGACGDKLLQDTPIDRISALARLELTEADFVESRTRWL